MMTYDLACELRRQAEAGADWRAYLRAAQAFEALGMCAAAERMRTRAMVYGMAIAEMA